MYSVPMALVDFIPVFLFGTAAVILMCDLYNKMLKGPFAIFSAGVIDIFEAGFLKALYKLLYAAGVCNFEKLSQMFFPVQAIGFMLAGAGAVCMLIGANKNKKNNSAVAGICTIPALLVLGAEMVTTSSAEPPVESGTMIFVVLMVVGLIAMDTVLCVMAVKVKKPGAIALFVVSAIFCLMMGYLSSRDFTQSYFNWIAEGVNVIGQGCLLLGTLVLHKNGLKHLELKKN